jgi:hypothetical protein
MKIILSILLLLVTGIYILPVKEHFSNNTVAGTTDIDNEKEEIKKKEKEKELFSFSSASFFTNSFYGNMYGHLCFSIPVPLHTVETPPPDLA